MSQTLKFHHMLPFYLEERLKKKGFYVQRHVFKESITFCRSFTPSSPTELKQVPITSSTQLSIAKCKELEARCDRIVSGFSDPYNSVRPILTRLSVMKQGLPKAEQDYVDEYFEENFPGEEGVK